MNQKILLIIVMVMVTVPKIKGADNPSPEAQWLNKNKTLAVSQESKEVIPVKALPNGWVYRDELLASWGTNLPAAISIIPDSTIQVVYQDERKTTKAGIVLPIKRASVTFDYPARLTFEQITLSFINVDFIYSATNSSDSHFILEKITKKIKLIDEGFPKLTSDDIIKFKVLMEYGTPKEFDGVWHTYANDISGLRIRKLDERTLQIEMTGLKIKGLLEKAIDDVYSEEGIEYKKRLMMDEIDL